MTPQYITCMFQFCGAHVEVVPTQPSPMIKQHMMTGRSDMCPASLLTYPLTSQGWEVLREQAASMAGRLDAEREDAARRAQMKRDNPITSTPPETWSVFRPGPGSSSHHHPGLNVRDQRMQSSPADVTYPGRVAQDYAARGDGTVKHIQCGTLHRPGQPCPLGRIQPLGGRVAQPDNPEDTSWQLGGRKDADVIPLDERRKVQPVPQGVVGESVGSINVSDLGALAASVNGVGVLGEEAIAAVNTAVDKLREAKDKLGAIQGQVTSQTLGEYFGVLASAEKNLEDVKNAIAHGRELGDRYVQGLSG